MACLRLGKWKNLALSWGSVATKPLAQLPPEASGSALFLSSHAEAIGAGRQRWEKGRAAFRSNSAVWFIQHLGTLSLTGAEKIGALIPILPMKSLKLCITAGLRPKPGAPASLPSLQ